MVDSSINPYDSSKSMDGIAPTQEKEMDKQQIRGINIDPNSTSFVQKYWHFDSKETKQFFTNLVNVISSEIKHEEEKMKEANHKLKESEQGND
jgi:hypothetical protein